MKNRRNDEENVEGYLKEREQQYLPSLPTWNTHPPKCCAAIMKPAD
jgi:hypothetical protein